MRLILFLAIFNFTVSAYTYTIDSGDVLRVEIYGEPELALDLTVDSLGFIEYPFIGKVLVKEGTVDSIKKELVLLLKDGYFVNPQLTVAIKRYKPFYIQGEVHSPGSYPYEIGMTIRKAIVIAGGLTERASKKKIYLSHANSSEPKKQKKSNMDATVRAGDVILIKESFF